MGDCTFEIDEYGIRRTSKTGLKTIEWENVRHVQKLSSAYLIELNEGSLPIPYRCFNAEEQDLFSSYIASEKPNKFENENAASGTGVVKTRRPF